MSVADAPVLLVLLLLLSGCVSCQLCTAALSVFSCRWFKEHLLAVRISSRLYRTMQLMGRWVASS